MVAEVTLAGQVLLAQEVMEGATTVAEVVVEVPMIGGTRVVMCKDQNNSINLEENMNRARYVVLVITPFLSS